MTSHVYVAFGPAEGELAFLPDVPGSYATEDAKLRVLSQWREQGRDVKRLTVEEATRWMEA